MDCIKIKNEANLSIKDYLKAQNITVVEAHETYREDLAIEVSSKEQALVLEQTWEPRSTAVPKPNSFSMESRSVGERLQRKKLSGAKRKKRRKAEKLKAGTWTQQKPESKSIVNNCETNDQIQIESFIPTHADHSLSAKISRIDVAQGGANSKVTELKVGVAPSSYPDIILNESQANLVQEKLLAMMDQIPPGSLFSPQFKYAKYGAGILWIMCANESTKNWLEQSLESLGDLWGGTKLTLVDSKQLPKRRRVQVRLPGEVEVEVAKCRLGKQNPGLTTIDWLLDSKVAGRGCVVLSFSVPEETYKVLEQAKFKAYYGLMSVTFVPVDDGVCGNRGFGGRLTTQRGSFGWSV